MKEGKLLIIAGSITSILGIIFHLQGQSMIGPESSFMYSNSDWITYGIQILMVGTIALGTGFVILKKK
ncbi:MAG: hypothetical protein GKS07_01325 [Nitrosopumilus sp.]|nr:MAG: hypothetical protein GKS07_01325 [Nitrosopumilus sp.]